MMQTLKRGLADFVDILFPSLCVTCGKRLITQEKYICLECWSDLPVTDFCKSRGNKVEQLFWGRVNIECAASYFSYKKGSRYQQLIHSIKYRRLKELGFVAGQRFGFSLSESDDFSTVDIIVPVPLHPKKEKKRGYNQSTWIARGIGESMKKKVSSDNLYRIIQTKSQTRKSRYQRWQNVEGIFGIRQPAKFAGKHILLIDDVVTTGSTLEACAAPLLQLPGAKVSIATLAFADN